MNREKAIQDVLGVIRDGSRVDRFLTVGMDGEAYTTDHAPEGPYIHIPVGYDTTEDEEDLLAENIVYELELAVS